MGKAHAYRVSMVPGSNPGGCIPQYETFNNPAHWAQYLKFGVSVAVCKLYILLHAILLCAVLFQYLHW